ncbi:MAG: DNA topoisomerase 3 [Verrucomicrobiota bacterium]|nr:DNA topoisomerase 3 [Verrucomicrobiota bacterium]
MSKSLIIAEKPSVAADLARALGGLTKKEDFFEGDKYVVSSAVGHLLQLAVPEGVEVKRGKWNLENLPVLPEKFDLAPNEKTKSRLALLKRLIKRPDVAELINACDAGREGELIFRNLVRSSGSKKPIRRLWLQSMTAQSIRDAFEHLRSDEEMQPLADAALSRSESDWLVGINSTRAFTAFNSKQVGGFQKTTAGRVQTPTLAIIVEREEKIRAFKERPMFEVFGDFEVKAGQYRGRWCDDEFKKDEPETERTQRLARRFATKLPDINDSLGGEGSSLWDEHRAAPRLWYREIAEAIRQRCEGKPGTITEEKKPQTQLPPLLYDLTTLQREANGRFGISAGRTLQIAQALYERHKVLTYPRTDSRYLPEDYLAKSKEVLGGFTDPNLSKFGGKAVKNGWVRPNKRIFNNAKVSDHFAIIPTGVDPKALDDFQMKIYEMVARRFVAVFYPQAEFELTSRVTLVEQERFRTDGKIIVNPGWLEVYGKQSEAESESDKSIVPVTAGESAQTTAIEIREGVTKPPARYNEGTLLSAMEGAGKLVDDDELREAMREKGLGTPATRSAVIEGLIYEGYVDRRGRELVATAKGISLITLLRNLRAETLTKPELTGEWEFKLKQMERGQLSRENFMEQIRGLTSQIVTKVKEFGEGTIEGEFTTLAVKCPKCGEGPFKEDYRTYTCASCGLRIWKSMAAREFEPDEIRTLLTEKRVGPLNGFISKMGRPFSAVVKLGEECKPEFEFENSNAENAQPVDLTKYEAIGTCPVCQKGKVYALDNAYACEHALPPEKTCTFRTGKMILQKEITREQAVKLITTGKTDLLPRFISKKGRPFSARLKLEKGKVGFEFEPRAAKPKKTASRKLAATEP